MPATPSSPNKLPSKGSPRCGDPGPGEPCGLLRTEPQLQQHLPPRRGGFQIGKGSEEVEQSKQRGALIVEATFVFPIMFLIIFMMLVAGNAYFQKCRVDSIITQLTIDGAAYAADPQLKSVDQGKLPTMSSLEIYPYRAFSGADAAEISSSVSFIQDEINKRVGGISTGLFSAMKPKNVSIPKPDYDNKFFTSSLSIDASYSIELPVRMLFEKEWLSIDFQCRVEMPVSNVTEMIRNTDMAEDYMEQFGLTKPIQDGINKIVEAIGKVKSWVK